MSISRDIFKSRSRVNCLAPGLLHATMTDGYSKKNRVLRKNLAPLGTEGNAEDIAKAALFLASEESRWITGVLLPVDAGLMAAGPQSLLNNVMDEVYNLYYKNWNYKTIIDRGPVCTPGNLKIMQKHFKQFTAEPSHSFI